MSTFYIFIQVPSKVSCLLVKNRRKKIGRLIINTLIRLTLKSKEKESKLDGIQIWVVFRGSEYGHPCLYTTKADDSNAVQILEWQYFRFTQLRFIRKIAAPYPQHATQRIGINVLYNLITLKTKINIAEIKKNIKRYNWDNFTPVIFSFSKRQLEFTNSKLK